MRDLAGCGMTLQQIVEHQNSTHAQKIITLGDYDAKTGRYSVVFSDDDCLFFPGETNQESELAYGSSSNPIDEYVTKPGTSQISVARPENES